jgi:hypothetical protein
VPSQRALSVRLFLIRKQISTLEHPPHLLNLAPSDFFKISKLKVSLNRSPFEALEDIHYNMTILKELSEDYFKKCFHACRKCNYKITKKEYFEGDHA